MQPQLECTSRSHGLPVPGDTTSGSKRCPGKPGRSHFPISKCGITFGHMRVLIIGGTGLIGTALTNRFIKDGHEVSVLSRSQRPTDLDEVVGHIRASAEGIRESRKAILALRPDVIVHLLLYTEKQAQDAINELGDFTDRLVVLSSGDVYRNYDGLRHLSDHPPDPVPLTEDSPLRSRLYPYRGEPELSWVYRDEYEKILVERVLMSQTQVNATVLRLGAVYGPKDPQHRFREYVRRMWLNRPFILLEHGMKGWLFTHVDVETVAEAVYRTTQLGGTGSMILNVGEAYTPTVGQRIEQIGSYLGWDGEILELPPEKTPRHLAMGLDWDYQMSMSSIAFHNQVSELFSEAVGSRVLGETIDAEVDAIRNQGRMIEKQLLEKEDRASQYSV